MSADVAKAILDIRATLDAIDKEDRWQGLCRLG